MVSARPRRRLSLAATAFAVGVLGTVALTDAEDHAQAQPPLVALQAPATADAAQDPVLQDLERHRPSLNLQSARTLLTSPSSTVWITEATNGDVCLVERVTDGSLVRSRFSCKPVVEAERDGLIGGVPGHLYGIAPGDAKSIAANSAGQTTSLTPTNGAFRIPADATSLVIDGQQQSLPTTSRLG